MIQRNLYKLEEYLQRNQDAFDMFIGSVSFEKRCTGAYLKIKESLQDLENVYFLDYIYQPKITTARNLKLIEDTRQERIKLQKANKKVLIDLCGAGAISPVIMIEDPLTDITRAVENFANDKQNLLRQAQRICIDISTFTKPFFFLILKMIAQNFNKKHFFIVNTIPSTYSPSLLSFNIWGVEIMPAYNGIWDPQNRSVLIAILGFEGHKLLAILESGKFDEIIPLVGFPAYHPGLQDRALTANAQVLKRAGGILDPKYGPAFDPFETYKVLAGLFEDYSEGHNIAIAPLGPKPMCLAAAKLAIQHDLRILYAFPQEYSPSYSQEIGESFLYKVEM